VFALNTLANAYAKRDMFSDALQTYLHAKQLVPKCLYTCICYYKMKMGLGLLDEAAEDFEQQAMATIVSPDDPFRHHLDLPGPYKNIRDRHQRVDILWYQNVRSIRMEICKGLIAKLLVEKNSTDRLTKAQQYAAMYLRLVLAHHAHGYSSFLAARDSKGSMIRQHLV
jgi:aminopeptidase-like protein